MPLRLTALLIGLATALLLSACDNQQTTSTGIRFDPKEQQTILSSEQHDHALIEAAIDGIKLHEEYTPLNFETKQRAYIERLLPEVREAALEYLPTRAIKVKQAQASNIVQPHMESAHLAKEGVSDAIRAQVILQTTNQSQLRGETLPPKRMVYIVNMLVYDLDAIFFQSISIKAAE